MRRFWLALLLAVVTDPLCGCSSPPPAACTRDSDCPVFMRCEARACVAIAADAGGTTHDDGGVAPDAPAADGGVASCGDATGAHDSLAEFSFEQGRCGWHYGYVEPATSAAFVEMTIVQPDGWYVDPTRFGTSIGPEQMRPNGMLTDPGREPVEQWAVRRWISDAAGSLGVDVQAERSDPNGNGALVRVEIGGRIYWEQVLVPGSSTTSFRSSASITTGTAIDFIIDPYASDDAADDTRVVATLTWR